MKKLLILLLALTLLTPLYGQNRDITQKPTSYWLNGNPDRDAAWNWMKYADNNLFGPMGTGKTFYVDSNVNIEGRGLTEDSAFDTMVEAWNVCVDDRGDRIIALQGHNEDGVVGTAVMWQASVSGVTAIGLGQGSLKPTFDYNFTSNTVRVTAANVHIHNMRFRPSTSAITTGLQITNASDTGDYALITKCDFGYPETVTDEFADAIYVGTSTGVEIRGNFIDAGAQACTAAVTFDAATGLIIEGNKMIGDCSDAVIWNAIMLAEDILIEDNIMWNGDTAALNTEPIWELLAGTVGISKRNFCATNLSMATAYVGTLMFNFGNYYTEQQGGAFTAFNLDMVVATATTSVQVSTDD